MKLDDTHPDYFVDNGTENGEEKRTINFADGEAEPELTGEQPVRRKRKWKWVVWFSVIVVAAIALWVWIRYYNPYIVDGRMKCYVVNVERRGVLFKTYEADLHTESMLNDTTRVYSKEISVSVPDAEFARKLQELQGTGRTVDLNYETFRGVIPWRGASKTIVTGFSK